MFTGGQPIWILKSPWPCVDIRPVFRGLEANFKKYEHLTEEELKEARVAFLF